MTEAEAAFTKLGKNMKLLFTDDRYKDKLSRVTATKRTDLMTQLKTKFDECKTTDKHQRCTSPRNVTGHHTPQTWRNSRTTMASMAYCQISMLTAVDPDRDPGTGTRTKSAVAVTRNVAKTRNHETTNHHRFVSCYFNLTLGGVFIFFINFLLFLNIFFSICCFDDYLNN